VTSATATAAAELTNVQAALTVITQYSSVIGPQDRMSAASNFNSSLSTDYTNGVSGLVDADMTKLRRACKRCKLNSSSASNRCRSPTRRASWSSNCSKADAGPP
jgi:flagellin-like hook-associated protein FlgL